MARDEQGPPFSLVETVVFRLTGRRYLYNLPEQPGSDDIFSHTAFSYITSNSTNLRRLDFHALDCDEMMLRNLLSAMRTPSLQLQTICIAADVNEGPLPLHILEGLVNSTARHASSLQSLSFQPRQCLDHYHPNVSNYNALLRLPHLTYLHLSDLYFPLAPSSGPLGTCQLKHLDITNIHVQWLCESLLPHCSSTLESLKLHIPDDHLTRDVIASVSPINLTNLRHLTLQMESDYRSQTISMLLGFFCLSPITTLDLHLFVELWRDHHNNTGVHALYQDEARSDDDALNNFFYSKVAALFAETTFLPHLQRLNHSVAGNDAEHMWEDEGNTDHLPSTTLLSTTTLPWYAFQRVLDAKGIRASPLPILN